jgi:hypothetical protein
VADSTLEESSGRSEYVSESCRLGFRGTAVTVVVLMTAGAADMGSSQQKVSRFHTLQLKFSSRLPFSNDSAHFEKIVHMLNRLSTFLGSTLARWFMSKDNIGLDSREGIFAGCSDENRAVVLRSGC